MHAKVTSLLENCHSLEWNQGQRGLLVHQECLLCTSLDILLKEKSSYLKLNVLATLFDSNVNANNSDIELKTTSVI